MSETKKTKKHAGGRKGGRVYSDMLERRAKRLSEMSSSFAKDIAKYNGQAKQFDHATIALPAIEAASTAAADLAKITAGLHAYNKD